MTRKTKTSSKTDRDTFIKSKNAMESQIDKFLKKVGYHDIEAITDGEGIRHFAKGTAQGIAYVSENEGQLSLELRARLMELPSDRDLILPMLRQLLEMNIYVPNPARLALLDENAIVSISLPAEYVGDDDVPSLLSLIMNIADDLDDELRAKFGGTSKKRADNKEPANA